MSDHIFLSYSLADIAIAERLRRQLEEAGFSVWNEGDLLAGESWENALVSAVQDADSVIEVKTQNSVGSGAVKYEKNLASMYSTPIYSFELNKPLADMGSAEVSSVREDQYIAAFNDLMKFLNQK